MGFWKNLRAGAAFMREYQHAAMQTLPRWARVVRVGRRVFGTVSVDVEIHYELTPPHVEPYGSWPTPPEFLRDAPPGAASPAAAPPGLVERRLQILRVHLRQGTISQEEYEQHLREMRLDRIRVRYRTFRSCSGS